MRHEQPSPTSAGRIREALARGDMSMAVNAMFGHALADDAAADAEDTFRELLRYPERNVSRAAATCLGHCARLRGLRRRADVERALRLAAVNDPTLEGVVEDALDDIEVYVGE